MRSLLVICFAVLSVARTLTAAPPANWEVMRIYVREDEVGTLVPQDYSPVEIEDLAAALKREEARRNQIFLENPRIADAFYVAHCTADHLASTQSRWQIVAQQSDALLQLGDLSCALKTAASVPAEDQSLISNLRFSVDGQTQLTGIKSETNYWFGFSCTPSDSSSQQSIFQVRLPPATLGRMLISAPDSLRLTSPDIVVTKVLDPKAVLPQNWPVANGMENAESSWYVLHISGQSEFRLIAESIGRKDAFTFDHFVRNAGLTYEITPAGLGVVGQFAVDRVAVGKPIGLTFSKSLRIKNISISGEPIEWAATSTDENSVYVQLAQDERTNSSFDLRVECVGSIKFPFNTELPSLGIDRSYAWTGTTNLIADQEFVVEEVRRQDPTGDSGRWQPVRGSATQPSTPESASPPPAEPSKPQNGATSERKQWTASWVGVAPVSTAYVSRAKYPLRAASLTRLMLQSNWIAATTHLQITAAQLNSNEMRLRLGQGWFVDGLTIDQSSFPINYELPDGKSGEIVLNWERVSKEMSVTLRISSHLPQNTDVEKLNLQAPRVVSVIGSEQEDNYAIEQPAGFRIQSDPLVNRLILRSSELPSWQSQLLVQPDLVLIRGTRPTLPQLVFRRSSGSYSSKIQAIGRPEAEQLRVEYLLEVQPISGAIDRLSCLLNIPAGVVPPNWSLLRDDTKLTLPVVQSMVSSHRDDQNAAIDGETLYEIQLPEATSEKFTLRSEVLIPMGQSNVATVPLLSSTGAVSTDAILAVPRKFSLMHSSVGIESLPSSICCSSGELASVLGSLGASMVAYRYDPGSVSTVDLQTAAAESKARSWAWSSQKDHWLYSDGQMGHTCNWQIFAPESSECSIELPSGWVLEQLLLDGEVVEISSQTKMQQITIELPASERLQLKLQCRSLQPTPTWLTDVRLESPSISMDTLNVTERLWLQPSKLSIAAVLNAPGPTLSGNPTDSASFLPHRWWQWLTPDFISGPTIESDQVDVADMPPSSERWNAVEIINNRESSGEHANAASASPTVRVIDRGSLSGLCLAVLLAGSGLFLMLFGNRVWLWWSAITLATAIVILLPNFYAIVTHLVLLSLVCGAMTRLICVVSRSRSSSGTSVIQRGSTLQRSVVTSVLLISLAGNNVAHGQAIPAERDAANDSGVFGVLIPVNKQGEVSAKHVYAPRTLMNLLENPDSNSATSQPPQLLGAKYIVKLRGGTSLTTSYVQEFTAEFDVQFDSSDSELRLPFKSSQVQLLRGFVFGQEVYIGSRLKQSTEAITYYPDEPGRVRLKLQLIPKQSEIGERTTLELAIPKIATASLEVLADESLDVKVASRGELRRGALSNWEADLGPVAELKMDWPTRPQRTPMPNQSQVFSDTWLQIQDRQLVADCQLRIEGGESLPKQLHLIVDAGWEPVGSTWNDVQLVSSELSTIGNRRIYTVARTKQSEATVIRVLMVPKNLDTATTVNIPLFTLQENSLTSRTLAIATSKTPGWKITGADLWNRLQIAPVELKWDATKLSQQPVILRVPAGTTSAALQRLPESTSSMVAESNVVTFLSSETMVSYRAAWPQISNERPVLKLLIPLGGKLQTVQVNGSDAEYQVTQRGAQQVLLVSVDTSRVLQQLDVKMAFGTRLGKSESLPRIVLEDHAVVSSDYQVRCGAELTCSFSNAADVKLELIKPTTSASDMLAYMAAGVGRAELANEYRDSAQLPVQYELRKKPAVRIEENVMLLARTEQGWKATVETWLQSDGEPIEFVFFEIPSSLRELIESSELAYSISNSVTSNRATLCVLPKETVAGLTRVAFDFRMPVVGSSQSISIPDVQLLVGTPDRPILALPNRIENQSVRWSRVGRRLNDDWMSRSSTSYSPGELVFYQLSDNQLQASWSPATLETKRPEVLYSTLRAVEQPDQSYIGSIDYWLDPQNLLELGAHIPAGCELVGIQSGGTSAVWRNVLDDVDQGSSEIRILLQPNYLPVHLRMFVKWHKVVVPQDRNQIDLPLPILDRSGSKRVAVAIKSASRVRLLTSANESDGEETSQSSRTFASQVEASQFASDAATRWKTLLLKSLPTVSDLNQDELKSWLQSWNPQVVRLHADQRFYTADDVPADQDKRQYENVEQFWNWYLQQIETGEDGLFDSLAIVGNVDDSQVDDEFDRFARHYMIEFPSTAGQSQNLAFQKAASELVSNQRIIATILLCLASSLAFWLTLRLRNFTLETLAVRPWIYWAFLAIVAWLILPVAWPSLVIAGCAISLFVGQFFNVQRRTYAGRTV